MIYHIKKIMEPGGDGVHSSWEEEELSSHLLTLSKCPCGKADFFTDLLSLSKTLTVK